ncbi:MAG: glycine cleavage system protein T [Alphaproteobacteria bacterium]|nr:glycine cleavage system protein T [Alphaproteobacteria bacterium]
MSFSIAIGPRIRKSPFFDKTVAAGVTHFSTYNHMYMPVNYGDPLAEYDRLINHVDIRDVSVQRQVRLKGPDAMHLAQLLTPRNLTNLQIGKGVYMPICNSKGTLVNDPVLLRLSDDELWLSIADNDTLMLAEGFVCALGLDVDASEPDVSPLAVQGPKSHYLARDLLGEAPLRLSYFGFYETELEGIPLVVARSGWSKQGGYEFYLRDGSKGHQLWDLVMEAGKPYQIGPGAPNYIERVESGIISVNADTDEHSNPFELGLGGICDLDQEAEFIGKAALKKIKAEGVKRGFCGIFMDGAPFSSTNENPWPISLNGQFVGYATAAAYSPRLDKNIAVCLMSNEGIAAGSDLVVETSYGTRQATATSLPFIPPSTKVPSELLL